MWCRVKFVLYFRRKILCWNLSIARNNAAFTSSYTFVNLPTGHLREKELIDYAAVTIVRRTKKHVNIHSKSCQRVDTVYFLFAVHT